MQQQLHCFFQLGKGIPKAAACAFRRGGQARQIVRSQPFNLSVDFLRRRRDEGAGLHTALHERLEQRVDEVPISGRANEAFSLLFSPSTYRPK